uniref:F-box domain-containing protein n=1 Tax=Caenorhabditis tropicalis TaxID=1561998 RepID=A0A1I7U5X3_9PELO
MNLLNFPYLVQKEILMKMGYDDLFLLSFTSKRMQNLIKSVQWKEILRIDCYAEIPFVFAIIHMDTICRANIACKSEKPYFIETTDAVEIDGNHFSLFGKYTTKFDTCCVIYQTLEEEDIIEVVYNRLDFLFGKNTPVMMWSRKFNMLPKFPQTEITILEWKAEEGAKYTRLEEYFETMPIQKFVELIKMLPRLKEDSKFYKAESLVINESGEEAEYILSNFKGKNAVFYGAIISDESVLTLLKRWKHMNGFHSLVFLEVAPFKPRNIEKIQKELDFQMFPANVNLPSTEIINYPYFRFSFKFPSNTPPTYIVRDDGIVAYITLDKRHIYFQVKSFTEKQLVENGYSIR